MISWIIWLGIKKEIVLINQKEISSPAIYGITDTKIFLNEEDLKNISDKELQDVIVSMPLGDDLYFIPEDFFESEEGKYEFVGYEIK